MLELRVCVAIAAAVAALTTGCSGESEEALPPLQPLCEGGDEVRLAFTSIKGFGNFGSGFSGLYGTTYLVVDGQCNYWLGSETLRGLRTGTLDADASSALAEAVHFGRHFTVADYRDPGGCTDAGLAVLDDGTATLRTTCFPRDAPHVFWEAFVGLSRFYAEHDASAAPAWEPTTLLALREPAELSPDVPGTPRRPLPWTAALDLEPRSVTHTDLARGLGPDAGVLVEDAPTLAVLADLRSRALNPEPHSLDMLVRDARGRAYQLIVRDEPPARVRRALEAALAPVP